MKARRARSLFEKPTASVCMFQVLWVEKEEEAAWLACEEEHVAVRPADAGSFWTGFKRFDFGGFPAALTVPPSVMSVGRPKQRWNVHHRKYAS